MPIYRIWFSKQADPAKAWTIQAQATKDYPAQTWYVPSLKILSTNGTFCPQVSETPAGYFEIEGYLILSGPTNEYEIRGTVC